MPHQFWGTVTINGLPAPPGTKVSVRVPDVTNPFTTFTTVVDGEGWYGDAPQFFVPSDDLDIPGKAGGYAGDVLSFYVGDSDTLAATYVFAYLGHTRLDLAITTPPAWDINRDGCIDIFDLGLVGLSWMQTGTPGWIREDVNNDGSVDIFDLAIVGLHWWEGCP